MNRFVHNSYKINTQLLYDKYIVIVMWYFKIILLVVYGSENDFNVINFMYILADSPHCHGRPNQVSL